MAKELFQSEAKLQGELLDSLSAEASTSSIRVRFYDSDDTNTQRTPDASTKLFVIDYENTKGITEFIKCASHSTTNGITTLSTVTRGLQRDNTTNLTGSATRAQSWDAGDPIGVATQPYNQNLVKEYLEGSESIPGDMQFSGDPDFDGEVDFDKAMNPPIYADNTARDAALPTPREGSIIKNTAEGANQQFVGGTWVNIGSSTTANASETVAGKLEIATDSEFNANTDTGGTGAKLSVLPSQIPATKTELAQLSGTTNIAEANTFFGLTDATGTEMETLTDGSNADSLHTHAIGGTQAVIQTTRAMGTATGTQNVAHGLSGTPRYVEVIAAYTQQTGSPSGEYADDYQCWSRGWGSTSSNACTYQGVINYNAGTGQGIFGSGNDSDDCIAIHTYEGSGTARDQVADISAIDGTNITLNWTRNDTGSPTENNTIYITLIAHL